MSEPFHQLADGVEELLIDWARWMRPKWDGNEMHKAVGCEGGGYSLGWDAWERQIDVQRARSTNDAVNELSALRPALGCAIHHFHLNSVFRFGGYSDPRQRERRALAIYAEAKEALIPLLRRRGVHIRGT